MDGLWMDTVTVAPTDTWTGMVVKVSIHGQSMDGPGNCDIHRYRGGVRSWMVQGYAWYSGIATTGNSIGCYPQWLVIL